MRLVKNVRIHRQMFVCACVVTRSVVAIGVEADIIRMIKVGDSGFLRDGECRHNTVLEILVSNYDTRAL